MKAQHLLNILLFLLLCATLLNNDRHVSPFGFSFYTYHIIGSILVIGSGFFLMKNRQRPIGFGLPVLLFLAYVLYYIVQGFFMAGNGIRSGHIFLAMNALLLVSYHILGRAGKIGIGQISAVLSLLAAMQGVYCLLQYFGLVESLDMFFPVTGSLVNPNLTAMFMAMALPGAFYGLCAGKPFFRALYGISMALIVVSFVLLQCRAAVVGGGVGMVYLLAQNKGWFDRFWDVWKKAGRIRLALFITFFLALVFIVSSLVYGYKKESSDSRLMIWKISMGLGMEKPFFGHGLYSFTKEYNLAQAAFFERGKATEAEKYAASNVQIAYNDYIQNFVEGGLIGTCLYFGLIGTLLAQGISNTIRPKGFHIAYSGVLMFSIMSLFNSVQYTIPVFAVFVLYVAVLGNENNGFIKSKNSRPFYWNMVMAIFLLFIGSYVLVSQFSMSTASRRIKKAKDFSAQGDDKAAVVLLRPMQKIMSKSDDYWATYGMALHSLKKYGAALDKYQKLAQLTTAPELYISMGNCYLNLGKPEKAIESCSLAVNMVPNRIYPRYALMKVYMAQGDTVHAIPVAKDIIAQRPKGISKQAVFFKQEAQVLLDGCY